MSYKFVIGLIFLQILSTTIPCSKLHTEKMVPFQIDVHKYISSRVNFRYMVGQLPVVSKLDRPHLDALIFRQIENVMTSFFR